VVTDWECSYPNCDGGPQTGYCHVDCLISLLGYEIEQLRVEVRKTSAMLVKSGMTNAMLRSMLEKVRVMVRGQEGDRWLEMLYAIDAVLDRYALEREAETRR